MMSNFAGRQSFQFKDTSKYSKNRVVLAPLTHNMSEDNGDLSEAELSWLKQCAQGGFGIVITAATLVSPEGRSWQGQPGLMTHKQQQQFAQIAKFCRENEALSIVQLHHGGVRAEPELTNTKPIGPSEQPISELSKAGALGLSLEGVGRVIDTFAEAAIKAKNAGMDGVELHAAHNFMLSNFLNPLLNNRKDAFGGDINGRAKILVEIVKRIREAVGRDFLIGVRLSPESYGKFDGIIFDEQIAVANILAELPLDYIHWSMHNVFKMPDQATDAELKLLELTRKMMNHKMPLLVAGQVIDMSDADSAIELGADLVAIGRAAIGNPDWVNRINAGNQLTQPPYPQQLLQNIGFSQPGIDYMSAISGLVDS